MSLRIPGEPGGDSVNRIDVPTDLMLPVSSRVLGDRKRCPYERRDTMTLPGGEDVVELWELIVLARLRPQRGGMGRD